MPKTTLFLFKNCKNHRARMVPPPKTLASYGKKKTEPLASYG